MMVLTAELFFGALYFAAVALALFCAGAAARFGAGLETQIAVAFAVAVPSIVALRWRSRRRAASAGGGDESRKG